MKKILLASAALAALAIATPALADMTVCPAGAACEFKSPAPAPTPTPAPVPVPVPQYVPVPVPTPETFWIYNWVQCYNDVGDCVVNITVDGLNVHRNGYDYAMDSSIQFAVPNGTPVHVFERNGRWLHVTFSCPLAPTGLWSDTAGVPFMACR